MMAVLYASSCMLLLTRTVSTPSSRIEGSSTSCFETSSICPFLPCDGTYPPSVVAATAIAFAGLAQQEIIVGVLLLVPSWSSPGPATQPAVPAPAAAAALCLINSSIRWWFSSQCPTDPDPCPLARILDFNGPGTGHLGILRTVYG